MNAALIQLYLFGPFDLRREGKTLTGFRGDKARALLAYLALQQGQPVARQHLTTLLWAGYPPASAKASLRVTLTNLRQILAPWQLLEEDRQTIQLPMDPAHFWCDALALGAVLADNERSAAERWAEAQRLYRGELLPGFEEIDSQPFQAWLQAQRNDYRQRLEQLRPPPVPAFSLPNNLGRVLTPLVGRQAEIRTLQSLILNPDHALITVVGEGGVGKTRLALAVAQALVERAAATDAVIATASAQLASDPHKTPPFADGIWFVPLADIVPNAQVAEQLAAAIGAALHLAFYRAEALTTQLIDYLREKALLLILDNFEHLLDCADFLLALLQAARQVKLLVTSRQQLRLQVEAIFPLQGLPVPEERSDARAPTGASPTRRAQLPPSSQLFLERARRADVNFRPNQHTYADIAAICRLVDGLPLAIELAAAQVSQRSCSEIRRALAANYAILTADLHDVPSRQRSLRQVLEDSWRLLSPTEMQLLVQCTFFQGGFTAPAANAITGAESLILERLVQKSLLHRVQGERYGLHELVRHHARSTWLATDETQLAAIALRHSRYYLALVQTQAALLQGEAPQQAIALIRSELMNIQAAWRWAVAHGQWQLVGGASAGLADFYQMVGLVQSGVAEFELAGKAAQTALAQPDAPAPPELKRLLSTCLCAHAQLLLHLGHDDAAIDAAQQAITLAEAGNDPVLAALARCHVGAALTRQGHSPAARVQLTQALALVRTTTAPTVLMAIHYELGRLEFAEAHYAEAAASYEAALAESRTHRCRAIEVKTLNRLAGVYHALNNYPQVSALMEIALDLARQIGARDVEDSLLNGLGLTWAMRGDYSMAQHYLIQALAAQRVTGARITQAQILCNLGTLMSRIGDYATAFTYTQQGCQLMQLLGFEADLATAQFNLGNHAYHLGDYQSALRYSQQAVQHSQQMQNRYQESSAWNYIGDALTSLGRLPEAVDAFGQAARLARELELPLLLVNALVGLVQINQARGDTPARSLVYVEEILELLAQLPQDSLEESFDVYLTCYQVLAAQGDPRAEPLLQEAYQQLQVRAALISDEGMRHSFLTGVAAHRELVQLGNKQIAITA